jgi:hypothetical protein
MHIRARTVAIVAVTVAIGLALSAAAWILEADEVSAERQVGIATGGPFAALDMLGVTSTASPTSARWIRVDFNWTGAQPDGPGRYEWGEFDRVVEKGRSRGLSILGVLAYTPGWAQLPESDDKHPPVDLEQYVRFARDAARRFSRRGAPIGSSGTSRTWLLLLDAPRSGRRYPEGSASSTCSTCVSGLTRRITRATEPSASITKVERSTPQYVLPA